MSKTFYSHGKLLLTAEYVVLDGAKALALPTKFGQSLTVEPITDLKLIWESIDCNGNVWYKDEFLLSENKITSIETSNNLVSKRLLEILTVAKSLNNNFLDGKSGFKVASILEFETNWGLGSSSTLLNNISQWAEIDAFKLSNNTIGGSGYDIACAQNNSAIIYQLRESKPQIERITFSKSFSNQLFFVHLNRKQNSRDSIKTYNSNKSNSSEIISKVDVITSKIIDCKTIEDFNNLIETHESLIGKITNQTPIKQRLFSGFKNQIKSLGGWNGDFVLATGDKAYVTNYFKEKGYHTILDYNDMIL